LSSTGTSVSELQADTETHLLTPGLTAVFSASCALTVANIYYAQPLIDPIAASLGLHASLAGLIMMLTQLGYSAGLLMIVPLVDVLENRSLAVCALSGVVVGLIGVASSTSALAFLAASFAVGLCAVATQVLVPFASSLAPDSTRGAAVGNIMGGLLMGIMLARPAASSVAAAFGWRTVFASSAVAIFILIAVLWRMLPERRPVPSKSYTAILSSLPRIVSETPVLRRRGFYQGMLFAGFNVFWTGVPLLLRHTFGLSQRGIAVFALAGASGALCAPLAGRLADRGYTRLATGASLITFALAFVVAAGAAYFHSLVILLISAVLLDGAVQVCQVLNLRALYMQQPAIRGRLNALFMTFIFICGAVGSGLSTLFFEFAGWTALTIVGGGLGSVALLVYLTEWYPLSSGGGGDGNSQETQNRWLSRA
jgi:predicted MFS family arabinose efflux permease